MNDRTYCSARNVAHTRYINTNNIYIPWLTHAIYYSPVRRKVNFLEFLPQSCVVADPGFRRGSCGSIGAESVEIKTGMSMRWGLRWGSLRYPLPNGDGDT